MMSKLKGSMALAFMLALATAGEVFALAVPQFPVDTASADAILGVKADLVAWGVVLIGVALVIYAFRKVKSIVR
jgi:hypothetical protein